MKKLFKKLTSLLLSSMLLLSMATMSVSALNAEDALSYLTYEILSGEVTITGYKPTVAKQLVIPETIESYPVTAIGESAFKGLAGADEVVLPKTLEKICDYAFAESSLKEVVIPSSVKSVGDYAFFECNIKKFSLENGVESIGDYAFYEALDLYENGNYIPLVIPESVSHIGYSAFMGEVNIPFVIEVSPKNQHYSSEDNVLFNKDKTILIQFSSVRNAADYGSAYTIPDSVEIIADYAFYGQWDISELTFGKNVKAVGAYAFAENKFIGKINFNEGLESIGEGAFSESSDIEYTLPDTVTSIGESAFYAYDTSYSNRFNVPSGVSIINEKALSGFKSVFIPLSVQKICEYAFSRQLESVYYEGSVEQWEEIEIASRNYSLAGRADMYFNVSATPHEHAENYWVITERPTYTHSGEIALQCANCDEVILTKLLEALEPKISSVELADAKVYYEDNVKLNLKVSVEGNLDYSVRYSVNDESVVSVNRKGEVTALKRGSTKVTVTVTDENGNEYKDTCEVTVKYNLRQWIIYLLCFGWLWM